MSKRFLTELVSELAAKPRWQKNILISACVLCLVLVALLVVWALSQCSLNASNAENSSSSLIADDVLEDDADMSDQSESDKTNELEEDQAIDDELSQSNKASNSENSFESDSEDSSAAANSDSSSDSSTASSSSTSSSQNSAADPPIEIPAQWKAISSASSGDMQSWEFESASEVTDCALELLEAMQIAGLTLYESGFMGLGSDSWACASELPDSAGALLVTINSQNTQSASSTASKSLVRMVAYGSEGLASIEY